VVDEPTAVSPRSADGDSVGRLIRQRSEIVSNHLTDASTSADLWRLLTSEGGLQPEDYDEPIVRQLQASLNLSESLPFEEALKSANVSVERFVGAFFEAVAPYVAMWSDLLALFERAAATAGEHNLRVAYRFDEADVPDLTFDLEHFRQVLEIVEVMTARFDLSGEDAVSRLWRIPDVINRDGWRPPSGSGEIDRFAESSGDRFWPWPGALPPRPTCTDATLDALLSEAWDLASVILTGLRSISRDYDSLMALPYDDASPVASGASRRRLRQLESDHWLATALIALSNAARAVGVASEETLAAQLESALAPLRNSDPRFTEARKRLYEFLQLPIWKHRYELYSNWVCTQLVSALNDRQPLIHAERGTIRFAFSGTHLATFDGFSPRLHIWTELRVPLSDPVGKGRTAAIQPDITLLEDPITARRAPLTVECKQYRKASNRKFAAALTDYARGHVDARIILVNYGTARAATVLQYVDPDVVTRTAVVGELRPGNAAQIERFRSEVRRAVGAPDLDESTIPLDTPARITLRWEALPSDLDLSVRLEVSGEEQAVVSYQNLGSLDEPPFCALDTDVTEGQGPEVITIARWFPYTYKVLVHNYSNEAPLGGSGATVTLERDGELLEFPCPDELPGREWKVCSIDGVTGTLTSE
jgi:hypothetical protein